MNKKFCKDCKHFKILYRFDRNDTYICKLFTKTDLVTGDVSYLGCETARGNFIIRSSLEGYEGPVGQTVTCGEIGRYYEAL